VPVSALKGGGLEQLQLEILRLLPEGEPHFPEDQVTDQPERFLAAEVIREKAIQLTYHEVPYALAVLVEKYEEKRNLLRIEATLGVERDSQKKILIGQKGEMLKKIGTEARKELEKMVGSKIYLGLYVKVMKDWRENPARVKELDWHGQLEALSELQREPGDQGE
jgi:GTP-binding protein Era